MPSAAWLGDHGFESNPGTAGSGSNFADIGPIELSGGVACPRDWSLCLVATSKIKPVDYLHRFLQCGVPCVLVKGRGALTGLKPRIALDRRERLSVDSDEHKKECVKMKAGLTAKDFSLIPARNYPVGYDSPSLRGFSPRRAQPAVDTIKSYGSSSSSLLDIGCGAGKKTLEAAQAFKDTVGLDPSRGLLRRAQMNLDASGQKNVQFIEGRGEALPFESGSFDVVMCLMAGLYPAEMYRVLKPGGVAMADSSSKCNARPFELRARKVVHTC